MGTLSDWLGRATEVETSTSLTFGSKFRVFNVDATAAALTMRLPDARRVQRGGPIAYVFNRGSVNSFTWLGTNARARISPSAASGTVTRKTEPQ